MTDKELFSGTTKVSAIEYTGTGEEQSFSFGAKIDSVTVRNITDFDTIVQKPQGYAGSSALLEKTVGSALKRARILENAITVVGSVVTIGTSAYVNTVGAVYIVEVKFQ